MTAMAAAKLRVEFPEIPWSEPVRVTLFSGEGGYACRVCVALEGLKGIEVPELPDDPEAVRQHFAEAHA